MHIQTSDVSCGAAYVCELNDRTTKNAAFEQLKEILYTFMYEVADKADNRPRSRHSPFPGWRFLYWSDIRYPGDRTSPGERLYRELLRQGGEVRTTANALDVRKIEGKHNPNTGRQINFYVWNLPDKSDFLALCEHVGVDTNLKTYQDPNGPYAHFGRGW